MTISSSLNAGVSGLNANATKLATISDNISNASTFGYRRAQADFNSIVLEGGNATSFSAGGVRVSTMRLIDQRGPLVGSTNATDLAVDGRGLLPVTTKTAVDQGGETFPLSLATTGSFRPDNRGYLTTESGMVLMGWRANADGSIPDYSRVSAASLQPVQINLNQFAANPTTRINFSVNLPATSTAAGATAGAETLPIEYFNNVGTAETLDVTFVPTVPATGASNTWTMTLRDSGSGGAAVGSYTLVFNTTAGSGGTLASVTTVSGGAYDAATGVIPVTVNGGTIAVTVGRPGAPDGLTQLSDAFAPVSLSKNGTPVGTVTSVKVDKAGDVYALYDQGFTRRIYQIPLVDVANMNGLVAASNQTYQISPASGQMFLWNAGDGPTGDVLGFSREASTTDVAEELTQLIVTQRAYSSNAKVIQTVDEMLQETQNIKR
jgi:flagellar hook protein FlgE